MADHFYFAVYEDQNAAQLKAQVLTQQNWTVTGPTQYADGAIHYEESSGPKTAQTINYGTSWVVHATITS